MILQVCKCIVYIVKVGTPDMYLWLRSSTAIKLGVQNYLPAEGGKMIKVRLETK